MGTSHIKNRSTDSSVWLAGFSIDDFMVPSKKTEIAQVAEVVTKVVLDMATVDLDDGGLPLEDSEQTNSSAFAEVIAEWGVKADQDQDWADRKVSWPQIDPDSFKPAANAERRIEDNLNAIKLMREIQATGRPVDDADRASLLRYCGWGGLAKVFAPDGSTPHGWAHYRDELELLTSEKEFTQMRSSITSAFFTDPALVRTAWDIVRHLGFKGGRVIEPSAGPGHFLAGMPADLANKSQISAVELDPISAALLETGFAPLGVQVQSCALEKANLPVAFYDCVIGNIPFGSFRSLDTSTAAYSDWSIHNWFMAKAVDLVRPGGLIVLITSRHTMDSAKSAHRKWLAAHAELLGAYRLPTMAFKGQANTEAVTDLMVFKRREMPDFNAGGWIEMAKATETMLKPGQPTSYYSPSRGNCTYDPQINSYYVRHPENVVGLLQWESGQFGDNLNPKFDGNIEALEAALSERIAKLPALVYQPDQRNQEGVAPSGLNRYSLDAHISPGSFVLKDERICVSEGAELLDVDSMYTGTARKRLIGMIGLRSKVVDVIAHQARSQDDVRLAELQKELNREYDNFVSACGYLSTSANSRLMRADPDWPVMLALEVWNDEEGKAEKADIFSMRTVGHRAVPEKVDNVKDAMLISLALYGQIVLKDLSLRTGTPVMQVVKELREQQLAFRDPVAAKWVPADEYLSGHIRDKMIAAAAAGPAYAGNVPALEAVLPRDLGPLDVEARLGAPWIPVDVIEQFATELVNAKASDIAVSFEASTASWSLKTSNWRVEYVGDNILQTVKWGTSKRCALVLIEAALNQQPPTITVECDGKRVVDRMATLSAREKWQAIRDQFRVWIYQDADRRDRLLRIYNDLFNQLVERKYDGSHLLLQGMSLVMDPYGHQRDAIWRILVNGNTLLGHCVGAGKTMVLCAASMEMRRLGKAVKPVHVVQNSTLEQYTAEFVRLYPQAKVLMASKETLHGINRRTWCARVATGDWDAIIMTQATFERLPVSPEVQQTFVEQMLSEARASAQMATDSGAKRSLKEIEKRMKDHEARLERMVQTKADVDCIWFDELGIDAIMYDEAHSVKNLGRISKMPRIAGLPNVASQRAFDAFMKTRLIMAARGGKQEGIVFATATFLTNSIAEMHTYQVFLQPETLKKFGLHEFDSWSASFGESVTGIELAPDGSGYRMNTRYSRFVNLPELMAIFREVADIRTKRMLNLPTPVIVGGKPQTMVAKPSAELLEIVAGLVKRADAIRNRAVKPEDDNMLAVTNDGRKAALDVRMVNPMLPANPQGKLAIAADNMVRIWNEGHALKVTQLVFSDLGTPTGSSFNIYAEVKRLLVEKGVPAAEVEFIHSHSSDKARAKLFERVRGGAVRFLLGSTKLMGTGTNVQMRLKAIHQLDGPWVPSDVEQRDGRGDRQGNLNESIELWRYVTERSFDAYSWQLLNTKANFIEQVMTAGSGLRTIEDISMSAMTYAEIKAIASGNPLVMEKAGIDADVQKYSLLRGQWEEQQWRASSSERAIKSRLARIDKLIPAIEEDAKLAMAVNEKTVFAPATSIAQKAVDAAGSGMTGLAAAFRAHSNMGGSIAGGSIEIGKIGGFAVEYAKIACQAVMYVVGPNSQEEIRVDRPHMNDLGGMAKAVMETVKSFTTASADLRAEYGRKTNELASAKQLLAQEFEYADRLAALLERQREINAELDLDKDAAGTQTMAAEAG